MSRVEVSMEMWFVGWYCSGAVVSTRSVHKMHHSQVAVSTEKGSKAEIRFIQAVYRVLALRRNLP